MNALTNNKPLENIIAVVIGGGKGIGRATAKALAAAGAVVIITARTELELESTASDIIELNGKVETTKVDITQSHQVGEFAQRLMDAYGRVDILVNCAGVALIAPLEETSEADWDNVIDTNLKGTYLCIYHLLELLKSSQDALVVNIASKVGITGHALVSAYTAAKAGVIGFSRALAQELSAQDIRVVAICPGPVDTPMRWEATPHIDPSTVIPADTIANTILFIATLGKGIKMSEIVLESAAYDESAVPLDHK